MNVPETPAEEAMRLAAEIRADREQLGFIDQTWNSLMENRRIVLDRIQTNESRHRSLTAAHYADFAEQAREAS